MNVHKFSKTTISLFIVIFGSFYFMSFINSNYPYESLHLFFNSIKINNFHSKFIIFVIKFILIVELFDAIINKKDFFGIISSFKMPLILSSIMFSFIFIFIPTIDIYMFWWLTYLNTIIGLFFIYKSFIKNLYPEGIKLRFFIKELKNGTSNVKIHFIDRYAVIIISSIIFVLFLLININFAIYTLSNWRYFV